MHIRIGSRESLLAVRQTEIIKEQILAHDPQATVEIVTMKTTGDRLKGRLSKAGGKGLFVKELDQALLEGRIDIAVHSLKDMPMEISEEIPILAYSHREDPRDVLIYKQGISEEQLQQGGIIGSSSARRILQLRKLYPNCQFENIRGNVQTRLRRLEEENFDATALAAAGLQRLDMMQVAGRIFSPQEIIPAAGQGILAIQGRSDGLDLSFLNDANAEAAAIAERSFVRAMGGSCSSPIAAYAAIKGEQIVLSGLFAASEEDDVVKQGVVTGKRAEAEALGKLLAEQLKK